MKRRPEVDDLWGDLAEIFDGFLMFVIKVLTIVALVKYVLP